MKSFLNVLYRRILYKIPLKLLLVLLAVFGLLFACTKADLVITNFEYTEKVTSKLFSIGDYDLVCVYNKNCSNGNFCFRNDITNTQGICLNFNINQVGGLGNCGTGSADITTASNCTYGVNYIKFEDYTSSQCQSEYNLIPISEVDLSYCQSNNLCPSGGTPSDCPNVGVSNVFINDLFHPGAFNIVMNIPEEIDWDYAYTNSGNNMNIDVVGYNVDYEKMQEIIDIQNYKPNSEELSTIISSIVPLFVPGLCIILLLYFIFRFIKKIF